MVNARRNGNRHPNELEDHETHPLLREGNPEQSNSVTVDLDADQESSRQGTSSAARIQILQEELRRKDDLIQRMEEAMRKVEDDIALREAHYQSGNKRKFEAGPGSSSKKKNHFKNEGKHGGKGFCPKCQSYHRGLCSKGTVKCNRCGKMGHYAKECQSKDRVCFNCQEVGHISSQCTKPKVNNNRGGNRNEAPRVGVRAFNMNAEEAIRNGEVIFGTFLINSMRANVLIDSGANRSFVSRAFSAKID